MISAYRSVPLRATASAGAEDALRILRRRVARAVAGGVLACAAIGSVALAVDQTWSAHTEHLPPPRRGIDLPSQILLASWPIALATYVAILALLTLFRTGPRHDAAGLERALYRTETVSIAAPLAGVAFATPLTLHLAFHLGMSALDGKVGGTDFHRWMALSAWVVGHAHVVLAVHGFFFARALHRMGRAEAPLPMRSSWVGALAVAVGAAGLPGIVFVAIPPVLALLTGLTFIPLAYHLAARRFRGERARIAASLAVDYPDPTTATRR